MIAMGLIYKDSSSIMIYSKCCYALETSTCFELLSSALGYN